MEEDVRRRISNLARMYVNQWPYRAKWIYAYLQGEVSENCYLCEELLVVDPRDMAIEAQEDGQPYTLVIHHLNGDRSDERLPNLVGMHHVCHNLLHNK